MGDDRGIRGDPVLPVAALGATALGGVAIAVSLALFAASLVVWTYAFGLAVVRSARRRRHGSGPVLPCRRAWPRLPSAGTSSARSALSWRLRGRDGEREPVRRARADARSPQARRSLECPPRHAFPPPRTPAAPISRPEEDRWPTRPVSAFASRHRPIAASTLPSTLESYPPNGQRTRRVRP